MLQHVMLQQVPLKQVLELMWQCHIFNLIQQSILTIAPFKPKTLVFVFYYYLKEYVEFLQLVLGQMLEMMWWCHIFNLIQQSILTIAPFKPKNTCHCILLLFKRICRILAISIRANVVRTDVMVPYF